MKTRLQLTLLSLGFGCARLLAQDPAEIPDSIPGYDMLDEIVITGERPVVQSNGAKTTYNVADDPSAGASNVLDMLKKVPMVSVDGEGKVRLNGTENFKFQINGLDNPMLAQYSDQILKSMPASSVLKIEVITEPGAKEDAEGVGGIINIVIARTQKQDGYSGNVSANISNRDGGLGAYGIIKKDKVTMSANVNWQKSIGSQINTGSTTTEYLTGDKGFSIGDSRQEVKFDYVGGNLDFSWEPDSLNLFNAGANITYVSGNVLPLLSSDTRFDQDGNFLWKFAQDGSASLRILNLTANASYRHNFAPEGHHMILSYLLNFGRMGLGLDRNVTEATGYPYPVTDRFTSNNNVTFTREHTAQLDYTNNFRSEHHLLEAGAKGIFRRNSSSASYAAGNSPSAILPLPEGETLMNQPQDIFAAYASYTGTFGNLTAVAGARYEHTRMGIRFRKGEGEDFTTRLNDIVPNAALTWNFSPMSNIRLAYQMRISRPTIDQVNPYERAISPFTVDCGNPALDSERSHKVSLSYSNFGRVLGGNIGIEHTVTDNTITPFSYISSDAEGINILHYSYANIGNSRSTALTGFLNWNIIPHMSVNVSGRLAYDYLKAPAEGYRNHGWTGNVNGSWNYTVAEVWKFSAYGGWGANSIRLQGTNSGWYYYGVSAGRDLLSDKSLNISLTAGNFLTPHQDYTSHNTTHDAILTQTWTNRTNWRAGVSLTWKFGKLQTQVKKTGATLGADDASSASNKSGGGI